MRRHRLPWALSILLMASGSILAHLLGTVWRPGGTGGHTEQGIELAGRADHGYLTSLPLIVGIGAALAVIGCAALVHRRARGRVEGASAAWFLLLPPVAYLLQEIAERLLHAEAFPFSPAQEPAFLAALLLQVPFGIVAFLVGRALLYIGLRLARGSPGPRFEPQRSRPIRPKPDAPRPRIPVLALGHSGRGPPALSY